MAARRSLILNVDDSEASRYATTRVLKSAGYEVLQAVRGADALTIAAQQRPDLILLDVHLPDMLGFEVIERLRAEPTLELTPVLLISASFVADTDRVRGLDRGADGYLVHPVEPSILLATVRSLLRARQAEEKLEESRQRLDLVLESADVGFWYCDLPFNKLTWDARVKEHFWLPADAEVTIESFYERIHPDDREATRSAIDQSIANRSRFDAEYRTVSPDGKVRWVREIGRSTHDLEGRPQRFDGISLDVTDRKEAQEEREALIRTERTLREEAEKANRMKDEFLATLSHELRTPINAVLGWAQLLKRGRVTPQDLSTAVDTIERNSRAQAQLIEDLLDMSRISSGKLRLDVQPVDLGTVLEAAIDTAQPAAQAKGITVSKHVDASLGFTVSGDQNRLQQIVWNLISNAIKFTPRGGSIDVLLERADGNVEVHVRDTGIGISADFLPHVFDRFRQGDASTTKQHSGLGLGLAIVRHLAELHGGTVSARSAGAGKGATFIVRLPAICVPREASMHASISEEGMQGVPSLAGVKVVVADDEPDARELMKRVLEDFGATVHLASSALQALDLVRSHRPQLLISDIGMPQRDGYELIGDVRRLSEAEGGGIPAIALTAFARAEDRRRAMLAGYQVHLAKPIEPFELGATVASLVGRTGRPGYN